MNRIIDKLSYFLDEENDGLSLNRNGYEALLKQRNFSIELNNDMEYGGVNVQDFHFSKEHNKLVKIVANAN